MTDAGRYYAGRSQEDRRAERRERLLAAGLAAIGDEGLSATSVRGVCARAGLTPRYFYEEFGTVDALARTLFDREFDGGLARVGGAVAATPEDAPTVDRVRAAVSAVLEFVTDDPHRAALLLTEAVGTGALAVRRQERMDDVIAVLAAFGRSTYPADRPLSSAEQARADRAVRAAATFVAGGLAQSIDAWLRSGATDRPAFEDELATLITAVGDAAFAALARTLRDRPA